MDLEGVSNDEELITVRKRGDQFPRLAIEADGTIKTGDGVTVPVNLSSQYASIDMVAGNVVGALRPFLDALTQEALDQKLLLIGDSTSTATDEWFYLFVQQLATLWPRWTIRYRTWDNVTPAWNSPITIQTGASGRTLDIYNASISGWNLDHAAYRQPLISDSIHPDVILISHGHNEYAASVIPPVTQSSSIAIGNQEFNDRYLRIIEQLRHGSPRSAIVCIAQNPNTSDQTQAAKAEAIQRIAAMRGWGFINVHKAFLDSSTPLADLLIFDGLHPNAAGSALWADTVAAKFAPELAGVGDMPTLTPPAFDFRANNLLVNPLFATFDGTDFTGWTRVGNITASADTTNFETGTQAARLLQSASGVASGIIQDLPLRLVRGEWVTLLARIRRNDFDTVGTTGRVLLRETGGGGVSVWGTTFAVHVNEWHWVGRTIYCQPTATRLRAEIYTNSATPTLGDITVDRAIAVRGILPADMLTA